MKSSKFTCFIFLVILLISCTKDQDDQISLDQLLGTWRMSESQINGTQIFDYVENGVWLDLEGKGNFYLNYIVGSWYLEGDRIFLAQKADSGNFQLEYQILELSESHLVVQTVVTKNQYFWGFDQFNSDQTLTIIETYIRN